MSASEIANGLKKRNPDTFGEINCNTIEGWIDRSGAIIERLCLASC